MLSSLLFFSILQAAPQTALPATQPAPWSGFQGSCVSAAEEALTQAGIRAYINTYGPLSTPGGARAGQIFPHFPMGANMAGGSIGDVDAVIFNYFDHDAGPGWQDWDCSSVSFNTHEGTDVAIRSFEEQDRDVSILAACEGTVVTTHDGEFDRHVALVPGAIGNFVIVDHGGGRMGHYRHMKKWSVAVVPGQVVAAGEVLGMIGSSGLSTWPHLHFEIRDNLVALDPFTGPCNPGASLWAQQIPIERDLELIMDAITNEDPLQSGGFPYAIPRSGSIDTGDATLGYAIGGVNLPANSDYRVRVLRPGGAVEYDSGTQPLIPINLNPSIWIWYLALDIAAQVPAMHSVPGTWGFELSVNGAVFRDLDVEVMANRPSNYNRAPEPIAVAFDPPAPMSGDVVACRVTSANVTDLDFDVLRYHYLWTVDGVVVRDVTTAGSADMLPRGIAASGQTVQCAVAVGDDDLFLAPKIIGALIDGGMQMFEPAPGIAGEPNTITVEQATPNGRVYFLYSFQLGSTQVPTCPLLTSPLHGPSLAAWRTADAGGTAQLTATVPPILAGRQIYFQAFDLNACSMSNLLGTVFQ